MKWDIDHSLREIEHEIIPGTQIVRCIVQVPWMEALRIPPTPDEITKGSAMLWSVAIGTLLAPKGFFYGRTIRKAYLCARKAMKNKVARKFFELSPLEKKKRIEKKKVKKYENN